jgi:hypothetical protein
MSSQGRNLPPVPASFSEFWPYYMAAHQDPRCRAVHYVGTTGALAAIVATAVTLNPLWLLAGIVWGYGFAWIGHYGFEKNKPASFVKWWWSLIGDWKMYGLWITGRLRPHIERGRDLPNINDMVGASRRSPAA